jgi:hypothetical protein
MCARALVAQGAEFDAAIAELQVALRNRIAEISNLALAALLKMPTAVLTEEEPIDKKKKTGSES